MRKPVAKDRDLGCQTRSGTDRQLDDEVGDAEELDAALPGQCPPGGATTLSPEKQLARVSAKAS